MGPRSLRDPEQSCSESGLPEIMAVYHIIRTVASRSSVFIYDSCIRISNV